MRLRPRTLTSRLALLLATLALLAGTIGGVAATFGIRTFLMGQLDNELHQAAARNVTLKSPNGPDDHDADNTAGGPNGDAASNAGLPPGTITGHVTDGRITDLVVAADLDGDHLPTAADRSAVQQGGSSDDPHTVHLPTLGDYRVLTSRSRDGTELVTGVPQGRVDHTIGQLIILESVVLAAVVLLVAGVGAFAVRRAMRPLQHLATVARRVTQLPLESGQSRIDVRAEELREPTEVAQVGRAMNAMLGHVDLALAQRDESEQRLRDFAADASHELRTPLAVARSHAELLREYTASTQLPEQVHRSLQRITDETGRMASIVNDLLLLARLDREVPESRDDVDLTRILLEAVEDARVTAPDRHWGLQMPEEPVLVRGDEEQLRRLAGNLVANVRLHTDAGTHATCLLETTGDRVVLQVHDTGPGFPPDLLDQAHLRFARARHRRESIESTGLGLAIVQAVAQSHDGVLQITSTPGDTTVRVVLPASPQK